MSSQAVVPVVENVTILSRWELRKMPMWVHVKEEDIVVIDSLDKLNAAKDLLLKPNNVLGFDAESRSVYNHFANVHETAANKDNEGEEAEETTDAQKNDAPAANADSEKNKSAEKQEDETKNDETKNDDDNQPQGHQTNKANDDENAVSCGRRHKGMMMRRRHLAAAAAEQNEGAVDGPHLVQFATFDKVFLVPLVAASEEPKEGGDNDEGSQKDQQQLDKALLLGLVKDVLESTQVTKVGFALEPYHAVLKEKMGIDMQRHVDLSLCFKLDHPIGVAKAFGSLFKLKSLRMKILSFCDWKTPQLSKCQRVYAASKASGALMVYAKLLELADAELKLEIPQQMLETVPDDEFIASLGELPQMPTHFKSFFLRGGMRGRGRGRGGFGRRHHHHHHHHRHSHENAAEGENPAQGAAEGVTTEEQVAGEGGRGRRGGFRGGFRGRGGFRRRFHHHQSRQQQSDEAGAVAEEGQATAGATGEGTGGERQQRGGGRGRRGGFFSRKKFAASGGGKKGEEGATEQQGGVDADKGGVSTAAAAAVE